MVVSSRERLIDAAFTLFEARGFDAVTVDQIAEEAGLGRTTFFRQFASKEDVIFPDHDAMLRAVSDRLDASTSAHAPVAVTEAARLVLLHYLSEGGRARTRYRLTSSVQALRDREIAGQIRYQRVFREFIHRWMGGGLESALTAELLANAVVTAHNHVLRRWLRGQSDDPESEFEEAMERTMAIFRNGKASGVEGNVVVLRSTGSLAEILEALGSVTEPSGL